MYTIYKHLNNEEEIIYIGKSKNLLYRQRQHRENSEWFNEIDSIEYCVLNSKIEMDIAELYHINKHNPKYNNKDKRNDNVSNINIENLQWLEFDMNELLIQSNKKENKIVKDEYLELVKRFITTDKYIVTKRHMTDRVVYRDGFLMNSNMFIQKISKLSKKDQKIKTIGGYVYNYSDIILLEEIEHCDSGVYLLFSNHLDLKEYENCDKWKYWKDGEVISYVKPKCYIEENIEWD